MKQFRENKSIAFSSQVLALSLALLVLGSACGTKESSPNGADSPVAKTPNPVSALVASVPDGCGIETYVGPDRGYESPWVKDGAWRDAFEYSSGLGYEGTSGFEEHKTAVNAPIQHDPRCESLKGVFLAAPVDGRLTSERKYDLQLEISAQADNFPATSEDAMRTLSLPVKTTGALVIRVIKPCDSGMGSCWQADAPEQRYTVDLQCLSKEVLSRSAMPIPSGLSQDDIIGLYSMPFLDQCSFAVQHAPITLADGARMQVSLSGVAAKESSGSFLRIKRISIEN